MTAIFGALANKLSISSILQKAGALEDFYLSSNGRLGMVATGVNLVALLTFNRFAAFCQPRLWTISFLCGATIFRDEIPDRVTKPIGRIYMVAFLILYPVLAGSNLPALIIMQAVLSGADLGYRTVKYFTKDKASHSPSAGASQKPVANENG